VSADTNGTVPAGGRCAACDEPDLLGHPICPRCAAVHRSGRDALIVLSRTRGASRSDAQRELGHVFGVIAESPAGRAAAAGDRALIRVPAPARERWIELLDARGMRARSVRAGRAWTLMPAHFFVLLASIAAVGGLAGAVTAPMFRWTSPLLALALLLSAQTTMAIPLFAARKRGGPGAPCRATIDAVSSLRPGRARDLLADLLRLARPLLEHDTPGSDVPGIAAELLSAAAATATEVDRLERIQTAPDRHEADAAAFDVRAAVDACERARRTGIMRLEAAIATLRQLLGSTLELGEAADRLADLTRALDREARAQGEAVREVEALLRPTSR